jgi:hypothetical protein
MKIRNGFVSNSSSSSFIIPKSALSAAQIDKIKNYGTAGALYGAPDSGWDIKEDKHTIRGSTYMDNFDMDQYLIDIGVDPEFIFFTE